MNILVQTVSACLPAVDTEDAELRRLLTQYGIDSRRMSRLSRLALLGALPLRGRLPSDCGITLVSPFGSPHSFRKMCGKLAQQQPSPLDFTAHLHNAAPFHAAAALGLNGSSRFLTADAATWPQALYLAAAQLQQQPQTAQLVGWAYERQHEGETEGSIWWLLTQAGQNGHCGGQTFSGCLNLSDGLKASADTPFSDGLKPPAAFFPAVAAAHRTLGESGQLLLPADGAFPPLYLQAAAPFS